MKPSDLIEHLQKLNPDKDVLISNSMGYPAYDHDEQRFIAGFDLDTKTITIKKEVE